MKKIASERSWRCACAMAWFKVSLKSARLGSAVRVSCVAIFWIMTSASVSSSLVRRSLRRSSLMRPPTTAKHGSTRTSMTHWKASRCTFTTSGFSHMRRLMTSA